MKRLITFLMVLALLVSLVACTSPVTTGTTKATTIATTAAPGTTTAASTAATTKQQESYKFTIMYQGAPEAEMVEAGKTYYDLLKKKFNLDIVWYCPAQSAYAESIQLMFASTEYPELVYIPTLTDKVFLDACKNGIVTGVNDLMKNAPNIMKYSYDFSWPALKVLGTDVIYGIPISTNIRVDGFGIRGDWLKNVGIDYKEGTVLTIDELYNIAKAFTFNDPDGNKKNDTYGFGLMATSDGQVDITPVFQIPFDISGWRKYDEGYMDLKYSKKADNYKRMLTYVSKLWKDGLIEPDWLTATGSNIMRERLFQGKTGIFNTFPGHVWQWDVAGQKVNPAFNVLYMPALKETKDDTTYFGGSFSNGLTGFWSLMKSAKKPERIVEFLDYMLSDEMWFQTMYGLEGVTWNKKADGEYEVTTAVLTGGNLQIMRRANDPDIFLGLAIKKDTRARLNNMIGIAMSLFKVTEDGGFVPPISKDPKYIDYQKYITTEVTKIVFGEKPVDHWDEVLDGWYKAGGETFISQMREYIESIKK